MNEGTLEGPTVPSIQNPDLLASWGGFPIRIELTPLVLAVLLVLAGVFVAGLSVMLVYHWRRFPFEHDLFRWVERLYFLGVLVLTGAALAGIILSL
jgi:hypothetical protein